MSAVAIPNPVSRDADDHGVEDDVARDGDPTVGLVELHAVGQQVQEHLAEPLLVGEHMARSLAAELDVDRDPARHRERLDELDRLLQHRSDGDRLHPHLESTALHPLEVEHLVEQAEQVATGAEDVVDRLALGGREVVDLEQLGESEHRVQRRAQLVAHAGEELALRPVRRLGLAQRSLDPQPLRDVLVGHRDRALARPDDGVRGDVHPAGVVIPAQTDGREHRPADVEREELRSLANLEEHAGLVDDVPRHPGQVEADERGTERVEQSVRRRIRDRDPTVGVDGDDGLVEALDDGVDPALGVNELGEIEDVRNEIRRRVGRWVRHGEPVHDESGPDPVAAGPREPLAAAVDASAVGVPANVELVRDLVLRVDQLGQRRTGE